MKRFSKMKIYPVSIDLHNKTYNKGELSISIDDFLERHGKQVFKFTNNIWIAFRNIAYITPEGKTIQFVAGTRFYTTRPPQEIEYITFTKKYFEMMRKMANFQLPFKKKGLTVKTCIPTGTVYLHEQANFAIKNLSITNPETDMKTFFQSTVNFFKNYPSYDAVIKATCKPIEQVIAALAVVERKPYDFLETSHIDKKTIGQLMQQISPLIFNKDSGEIAEKTQYYLKYKETMDTLLTSHDFKVKPKKIAEVEDNLQSIPSDEAWKIIYANLIKIGIQGRKNGYSEDIIAQNIIKYRQAINQIMKILCIAHVASEFVLFSLLKMVDPKSHFVSVKANPIDLDDGTKIISSIVWATLKGKITKIGQYIQSFGYQLFLKTKDLTENDRLFLTELGVTQIDEHFSVYNALMHWIYGTPSLIQHSITKRSTLFKPELPEGEIVVTAITCSGEFFCPSENDIVHLQPKGIERPAVQESPPPVSKRLKHDNGKLFKAAFAHKIWGYT